MVWGCRQKSLMLYFCAENNTIIRPAVNGTNVGLSLGLRFDKKEADLLTQLSRLEIEREEETSTLFRAASLTTTLMDGYMRSVCGDFLHTALFPTIHRFGNILA